MRKQLFICLLVVALCSCTISVENSEHPASEMIDVKSNTTETPAPIIEPMVTETPNLTSAAFPTAQEIISVQNADRVVELTRLEGIGGSRIYLSADGNSVFFFQDSKIIWVDLQTLTTIEEMVFGSPLGAMALFPDGTKIAIAFQNGTVQILELPGQKELKSYQYPSETNLYAIAVSPNGSFLAATQNNHIILRDLESDAIVGDMEGLTDQIISLQFTADEKTLLSGAMDNTISVWDVPSASLRDTVSTDYERVGKFVFSSDGSTFATPLNDDTSYGAIQWNTNTIKPLQYFRGHEGNVISTAYSADGSLLATSSYDCTIKLWNIKTGEEIATLSGQDKNVFDVVFSPDGRMILSSDLDGIVIVWGISSQVTPSSISSTTSTPAYTNTPSNTPTPGPTNFLLNQSISVDNADKLALWRTLPIPSSNQIAFTPDGKYLVVGYDGTFHVWDYMTGIEVYSFGDAVNGFFDISPNSRQLLGEYSVYDLTSGEMIESFLDEQQNIDCTERTFSSNGLYAACAGYGVTIWDAQSWQIVQSWLPEKGFANAAILSDDGRKILLSYPDSGVEVYNTLSGTMLASLEEDALPLFFSVDGKNVWLLHLPLDGYRRNLVNWNFRDYHSSVLELSPSGYTALRLGSSLYVYDEGGKDNPVFAEFIVNKEPYSIELEQPHLYQSVFSPDMKLLAGYGDDGELQLWALP